MPLSLVPVNAAPREPQNALEMAYEYVTPDPGARPSAPERWLGRRNQGAGIGKPRHAVLREEQGSVEIDYVRLLRDQHRRRHRQRRGEHASDHDTEIAPPRLAHEIE